jgi:glycerol-3-phosphate acyltransferase PlsY
MSTVFVALISYLIGSFPTGVVISRRKYGLDVREVGSGNIGATNVKRIFGWYAGLLTFGIDFFKAILALWLVRWFFPENPWLVTLSGIFVVLGHCFSIFLRFRGGKGVATSLGCILFVAPVGALIAGGVYLSLLATTRISAIGSLGGVLAVLIYLFFGELGPAAQVLILSLCFIIILRHLDNIRRLRESWRERQKR